MRTTSRIRSWRAWSTPPAASDSSPPERSRIARSSGSASSPKSASSSSSSSLEARPSALLAQLVEVDGLGRASSPKFSTARDERRVDRAGRAAEAAGDEVAQLVDHRRVAVRGQHVQQRLRGDDLADRRRERRRADLGAHLADLVEHLVEPVARAPGARSCDVERSDEADRELVLRGAHGDARRERRHRLVADVLVDEVGRLPEPSQIHARVETEPGERLRDRLGRDAVHGQRDGIDGGRDHVGAGARRLDRRRESVAACALRVEADRQAGDVAQLGDELARRGAAGARRPGR